MRQIGLDSIINQYINNNLKRAFTAIPCRVTSVNNMGQQRINVQPIINIVKTSDEELEHAIIQNVPVVFPGSSTSQFSFPVNVGDTVLCVFSQRSLDRFKLGAKNPHRPIDLRKMSRNDAVAIPGLFPFEDAVNNPGKRSLGHSTEDAVVTHNIGTGSECEVRLKPSGDVIINSPSNVQVNCETAEINAPSGVVVDTPTTKFTGNVNVVGDVTASGVSLVNHTHGGVQTGPGNTGVPN